MPACILRSSSFKMNFEWNGFQIRTAAFPSQENMSHLKNNGQTQRHSNRHKSIILWIPINNERTTGSPITRLIQRAAHTGKSDKFQGKSAQHSDDRDGDRRRSRRRASSIQSPRNYGLRGFAALQIAKAWPSNPLTFILCSKNPSKTILPTS